MLARQLVTEKPPFGRDMFDLPAKAAKPLKE
jgi:hypothetical protein